MSEIAYRLKGVVHTYGARTVLRIPALEIPRREIFTILGPNGAGKSTLLRLLALLETPTHGSVSAHCEGREVNAVGASSEDRRRMAMVFQRPLLLSRSVWENVAYGLRLRGERDARRAAAALLESLGLARLADSTAHTLSGGEIQRVALARALIVRPEILLLDEPTANLDPASGALIEDMIHQTHRRDGTTIILVTHNIFQAKRLATQAMLLLDGEMIEHGQAAHFFARPQDPRTAHFLAGEMTF